MKVYVYPADLYGCGFLRLIWPARALIAAGHDVVIVAPSGGERVNAFGMPMGDNGLRGRVDASGRTVSVNAPADADVMVMQRITHQSLAEAIPIWRAQGIAVVVDMDDDLSAIHPSNPAWRSLHPTLGKPGFSWNVAKQACMDATLVTTSTPDLAARYAPHGRSAVLYNCVPEVYLQIPRRDSRVIGWGGSVGSHPDDLQAVGASLAKLYAAGEDFRVVGPQEGVARALGLPTDWANATGGVDIAHWPAALSREIGIGIAPLADTRFNSAKSWLKPLEYAALGIPAVMSPRTEYRRLNKLGVGSLAAKPKEWERELITLARHTDAREEASGRGREVASMLTIERNAGYWMEAWTEALRLQRGLPTHATRQADRVTRAANDHAGVTT